MGNLWGIWGKELYLQAMHGNKGLIFLKFENNFDSTHAVTPCSFLSGLFETKPLMHYGIQSVEIGR